jgi:prepilin-type processing-associated H-X9-DG protein
MIELLVVIAIIGVLAAVLLPALARAKSQAQKASCLSRLKQWDLALMMYADENDEYIPRESFLPGGTVLNAWAQVQNPLAGDVWYNALSRHGLPRASSYAPSALRAEFYDRRLLFHCPKASFAGTSGTMAYFSIAMNSRLILASQTTVRLSAIQVPASTVTFIDARLPGEKKIDPASPSENEGQPSAYATRFSARHSGRGTLSFADGHVECLPGDQVVANGYAIVPQRRIVWTTDPNLNPMTFTPIQSPPP